jgi:hypothetical protein
MAHLRASRCRFSLAAGERSDARFCPAETSLDLAIAHSGLTIVQFEQIFDVADDITE